jgi:hypothetical protein
LNAVQHSDLEQTASVNHIPVSVLSGEVQGP